MPWYNSHHHGSSGHSTTPSISSSSRPGSRAPSPTRGSRTPASSLSVSIPSRSSTLNLDPDDPLSDYFSGFHHGSSGQSGPRPPVTPGVPGASSYQSAAMADMLLNSGTITPGGAITPGGYSSAAPVEIVLDTDHLVLRGQGGDMNPAYLSGHVLLKLNEATNIKEITMNLSGKAKVQFSEATGTGSRGHHFSHPIINHDWSFLEGDKRHTHTLKAGHHTFPFSFTLDGNLPSSFRTYQGDATIQYKLRALVVRSGFSSNFTNTRTFSLVRSYTREALEFNQTLEIENTWPGKIMYAITLPFKAYAAGDEIPVNVKFMPIAKGVRVLSVSTVIKEYSLVHTRNSSHPDSRVAASTKHEIRDGRAIEVSCDPPRPTTLHGSIAGGSARGSGAASGRSSNETSSFLGRASATGPASAFGSGMNDGEASFSSLAPADNNDNEGQNGDEDVLIGDDEINTSFTVYLPTFTTPSHTIHPVFVTHKIKWSCAISNQDGHISELRCALPIIVLDHSLLDEARSAGAATRALLFGGSAVEEAQQVDLPSYSNHVYDRLAITDSSTSSYGLPRSVNVTPRHSPSPTPPHSRPPSRPASPSRGFSRMSFSGPDGIPATDVPPRRQLSAHESELLRSLGQLSVDSHSRHTSQSNSPGETPPDSRDRSRPHSRMTSRANSRANSPERDRMGTSASAVSGSSVGSGGWGGGGSSSGDDYASSRPGSERRHSALHGLLHLPAGLKPIKPLSAFTGKNYSHRGSQGNVGGSSTSGGLSSSPMASRATDPPITRNAVSFTNLGQAASDSPASAAATAADAVGPTGVNGPTNGNGNHSCRPSVTFALPKPPRRFQLEGPETPTEVESNPLSRVPSYNDEEVAIPRFVVPLDPSLPTYDDSERQASSSDLTSLTRPRSESALTRLRAEVDADEE